MEGYKLDVYNKLAEKAKEGGYEIYGIDVIQTPEVCLKYLKHSRAQRDVEDICKEVPNNPIPYYHKILDPIELVDPGWKARQPPPKPRSPTPPRKYVAPKQRRRRRNYSGSEDSDEACFVCYG